MIENPLCNINIDFYEQRRVDHDFMLTICLEKKDNVKKKKRGEKKENKRNFLERIKKKQFFFCQNIMIEANKNKV